MFTSSERLAWTRSSDLQLYSEVPTLVYFSFYRDDSGSLKIAEMLSLHSDSLRLYSQHPQFGIEQIFSKPTIQNVG
jgi:hypothetical protein